eukprot:scaffold65513_cov64-Phaeocystis_antarctica.AAC.7
MRLRRQRCETRSGMWSLRLGVRVAPAEAGGEAERREEAAVDVARLELAHVVHGAGVAAGVRRVVHLGEGLVKLRGLGTACTMPPIKEPETTMRDGRPGVELFSSNGVSPRT